MNPENIDVHERIRRYGELKKDPYADLRTVQEMRRSLEYVNLNSLSVDERKILFN